MSHLSSQAKTELLVAWGDSDQSAPDKLLPLIDDEPRCATRPYVRRELPTHTLRTTALVYEAYLRLTAQHKTPWRNRAHFFAISAHIRRRILLDQARRRTKPCWYLERFKK